MAAEPWKARRPGPWIALDCGIFRHRKLENLNARSALLWIALLCHCGDELTDGHVSTAAMRRLLIEVRASSRHVGELRAAGLLEGHGPWEIPAYLEWNPPRDHVQAKRDAGAARVRAHRARRRLELEHSNALPSDRCNATKEVEVDIEGVSTRGSEPTPNPATSGHPDTLHDMTDHDTTSLAQSAAALLEHLRRQTA